MLRVMKFVGITVGTGMVLGFGVVAWLYYHRLDAPIDNASSGAPVALQLMPAAASSPAASPVSGGSIPLASNSVGSTTAPNSSHNQPSVAGNTTDNTTASLPSPQDFGQYEQYKDRDTVMYGDVVVGTGAAVTSGSVVSVGYRGWLTNGTLFDENYSSGKAFAFKEGAGQVIVGWEQGLYGMKVGGKRRLIVPAKLGYGATGKGPIPPNSTLVFDVELLGVQ